MASLTSNGTGTRTRSGLDGQAGPGQRPVDIDDHVKAVGGRTPEDFPDPAPTTGNTPVPRWPGRFLLRLISVLPERCPRKEQTKFYLMSGTVLANAAVAAYSVPTGLMVAYPGLHGPAKLGLSLLGAAIVGIMDALIVGHWVSPARFWINPPDQCPSLPGPWRRLSVFIPRLGFTFVIVSGLGLLLTLSANSGVIKKQAALDAIKDRNTAVSTAQTLDDQTIKADTTKLNAAEKQLADAEQKQNDDEDRASCELYGTPRVAGCSPRAGNGPNYRHYQTLANGSDQQAVTSAQTEVNKVQTDLNVAIADRRSQSDLTNVKAAAATSAGLSAVNAEWNEYADSHHLSWADRYLMELIILGVDLVPLGMKLLGGVSSYEAIAWEGEWSEALGNKRRRRAEHSRLSGYSGFYEDVARDWRITRSRKVRAWLAADSSAPVEPSASPAADIPPLPPTVRDPSHRQPSRTASPRRRPGEGPDPLREGRNAAVGDVVRLSTGEYLLLAQITNQKSYNGDVFIAGLIRYPGQVAAAGRDIPVRAVKFTRTGDTPRPAEFEFLNRFPAPGETLLRTQPKPAAGNSRLVYESEYFPRSDVMRYLYGRPRRRYPRATVGQAIEIMRSMNDAHRRIWDEGFLHNDSRLRNLIMPGPLEDGRYNPDQLTPRTGRAGVVMLCDWGSLSYIDEPLDERAGVTASVLEGDPAVIRVLLGLDPPLARGRSPLSVATDHYTTFACAYQLLTGGISPTQGLLQFRYNNDKFVVARLEAASFDELVAQRINGWPDALVENPLPVRSLNPDVPPALAALVDLGVRANWAEREPPVLGTSGGLLRSRDVAAATEDAIDHVAAALSAAELEQQLPGRHPEFLWQIEEPVGWPSEVLRYVAGQWPEHGV